MNNSSTKPQSVFKSLGHISGKPIPVQSEYIGANNIPTRNTLSPSNQVCCSNCCGCQCMTRCSCCSCCHVACHSQHCFAGQIPVSGYEQELQAALRESLKQQNQLNQKLRSWSLLFRSRQKGKERSQIPEIHSVKKKSQSSVASHPSTEGKIWKQRKSDMHGNLPNNLKIHQKLKSNEYGLSSPIHKLRIVEYPKESYIYTTRSARKLPRVQYPVISPEVYRDSVHRNHKHQKQHLYQTFELQSKLRKDFIQKVTNGCKRRRQNKKNKYQSFKSDQL